MNKGLFWWVVLTFLFLVFFSLITTVESEEDDSSKSSLPKLDQILKDYDLRKQKAYREKFCRNQDLVNHHKPYHRMCPNFNRNYLKFFLSLFIIISIGAIARTILRMFDVNIPYTVILIILGLLIGLGTRNEGICTVWSMYTRIARTPPKIILFVFLPVLIYESAFAMKAHVFYRSALSILILALPGMVITTFITAFLCQQFFFAYKWNFMVASLYGSIISATDPVAVVAILKEIGTSEMLSITIEGESLLNDGVAILFYEIFVEIVKDNEGTGVSGLKIFGMLCRIAIGGPVFGWFMAKLSICFLSRIFNDAAVEVSITLVAAYLTYYIGEAYFGVSGVMAVVALGIVMSAERTCISPEVQGLVQHFWEMLGYLGNTVLFVMVGIMITESAINNVTLEDGYYLIFLYFALNISRLLMIVILSPILSHIGYGLSWQNMMVMTWGGLRGAVGICLSLEVYKDQELCDNTNIGPKFLLQTAGIVLLTLLINGTTTKALLNMLKLTELSIGKIQDMGNAVKQIQSAQQRAIDLMKHDRILGDCNYAMVEEYTSIENPYAKHKVKTKKLHEEQDAFASPSLLIDTPEGRLATCPTCEGEVESEPTLDEYREMTEEARLRVLKAMKVSCWRQYEQGILTEEAVQILVTYMENCEDLHLKMFHTNDLKKFWEVRGFVRWMRNKLLPFTVGQMQADNIPPQPDSKCRKIMYKIAVNDWFDGLVHILILLNMIPIIWETVFIVSNHVFNYKEILGFLITNIVFVIFLSMEFTIKLLAFGCWGYWSSKWNILDAFILIVSFIEICLSVSYLPEAAQQGNNYFNHFADTEFLKFLRFIRIIRVVRILRLFRPLIPRFMNYLNSRVNRVLFFGYDIAKGSATAIDDVVKFLPQMIENQKVLRKFKAVLEDQRLILLLEMGIIQMDHLGIAIAVKTRHANRAVLNQMRDALKELKEDGLIDEKEFEILLHDIESKMKGLWHTPAYMTPRRPEMLLADLQWVLGNSELLGYLLKQATVLQFVVGDTLFSVGDEPNGIYIVISGVVKINYQPSFEIIQAREESGIIPNSEVYIDLAFENEMSDYVTTGAVIGELGVLVGSKRASNASCVTGVTLYHVSQSAMYAAIASFDDRYDSLEGRLWRTFGMKLASSVMPSDPAFQSWTMDKIKTHLEQSAVPTAPEYMTLTFPDFISDVVLIYGQVVNAANPSEIFTAPCMIPQSVLKIMPIENWEVRPRVMILSASDEIDEDDEHFEEEERSPSTDEIHKYITSATKPGTIDEDQVVRLNRPSIAVSFGVRRRESTSSRRASRRLSRSQSKQPDGPKGDGGTSAS